MTAVLTVALILQFAQKHYVRWANWRAVARISVVGTLASDNLVDTFGVTPITSTDLFTVAQGIAAGDLVSEQFGLGDIATGVLFALIIRSLSLGYAFLKLDPILGFWLAYIFTRPLGASVGDFLSQPGEYGGLGLGAIVTSALLLGTIILVVARQSLTNNGLEAVE